MSCTSSDVPIIFAEKLYELFSGQRFYLVLANCGAIQEDPDFGGLIGK